MINTKLWRLTAACGFAVIACTLQARAFGPPTLALGGEAHMALFDTAFDGSHGLAVGAAGEIVVSEDGGKTWAPQSSGTELGLLGAATRGGHSIAVGQMGTVLIEDGKSGWKPAHTDTQQRLMSVAMGEGGVAYAVGSFGTVLKSTDNGATWKDAAPDWAPLFADSTDTLGEGFHPHLYTVALAPTGEVFIAGELSFILKSADGGASWHVVHKGVNKDGHIDPSLFGISLGSGGTGYAVGQSGAILRSTDGGNSWAPSVSGTQANLLGVLADDKGGAIVAGMRITLSSVDGQSWSPLKGGDFSSAWYSGLARPAGASRIVAVGQQGHIVDVPE